MGTRRSFPLRRELVSKRWHPGVLPQRVVPQGGMPGCWWLGKHLMPSTAEPGLWLFARSCLSRAG